MVIKLKDVNWLLFPCFSLAFAKYYKDLGTSVYRTVSGGLRNSGIKKSMQQSACYETLYKKR